jgi:DNA-binding transcriptional regulator YiaG
VNFARLTGRDIRRIRTLSGLTTDDFARVLGVGHDTYLRWESLTGQLQLRNTSVKALEDYYAGSFSV